jgi:hypothetical protein
VTARDAIRTLISVQPGFGQREINGDLERLGFAPATVKDLAALGGYVESVTGVWALPESARSCDLATRNRRGLRLEALSHDFRRLGCPAWQAARNAMVLAWIRADRRAAGSLRVAA